VNTKTGRKCTIGTCRRSSITTASPLSCLSLGDAWANAHTCVCQYSWEWVFCLEESELACRQNHLQLANTWHPCPLRRTVEAIVIGTDCTIRFGKSNTDIYIYTYLYMYIYTYIYTYIHIHVTRVISSLLLSYKSIGEGSDRQTPSVPAR